MKKAINNQLMLIIARAERLLSNKGETGFDTLIKILISVVVGVLALGLITGLLSFMFPEIAQKIMDAFGISGTYTPSSSVSGT